MNQPRLRLGEILLESGLLSQENLNKALEIQKEQQLRLGTILLQEGFISEAHLLQALSRHLSIPWVSIWRIDIPDDALALVPSNVAEEFFLMPIYIRLEKGGDKALYVAMNDPSDNDALRFVAATAGMDVKPMIASPNDIAAAIRFYYYGEDVDSTPPASPIAQMRSEEEPVEDLSDEVELVPSEQLPIDLYAGNPPDEVATPRPSIQPETAPEGQPDIIAPESDSMHEDLPADSQTRPSRTPRASQTPNVEIPERLSSTPTINEDGDEVYQNKEAAQREAERRIYGVGRKKSNTGFALTLLDGTTLSFGGNKESIVPDGVLTQKDFFAALSAMAAGTPVDAVLPSEKWQSYMAATLQLLFKKGLLMYDEFIDTVDAIEKK
ncbi:MAG: hypothetical protein JXX29_23965 [Deltaproteobacteria bacterium]|nr:hypothetical protein [Deltaproteobacteria bacterium]MBN2674759.1 hypothetical protein [Deltaproteobacteria bacterium]